MNIIFSSCGNDSVALIQWAFENELEDINVAYSDTKWAADWWYDRVEQVKKWVELNGGRFHVIDSEGFEGLVRRKKAFPTNGMAFCSYELKIKPAMDWLEEVDQHKKAVCYTGVMRIESERRKDWPEVIEESQNHGGRKLVSPLAQLTEQDRNDLLGRAGFEVLEHRSAECYPCVNANRADIQAVDYERVKYIGQLEKDLGVGIRSGNPRYMFRAKKHGGAEGFEQVYERACSGAKHYHPDQEDLFGCDSGFCGI